MSSTTVKYSRYTSPIKILLGYPHTGEQMLQISAGNMG
jgi:hypothetical protein